MTRASPRRRFSLARAAKTATVALTVLAAANARSAGAQAARAEIPDGKRVITPEAMRSAGVTRVADVLFLIDEWLLSTVSGYTWKASPNGLSGWQNQRWVVLIDGQRADVDLFDAVNLNALPIGVDQIDSVVVVGTPGLHQGFFSDTGLIHFYTSRPRRGKSIQLVCSTGNETGDPGPYRFTRYATPNIDKIGPDGSVTFALAGSSLSLRANATFQIHNFTDPAVRHRNTDILRAPGSPNAAGIPNMRRTTASIAMVIRTERSRHRPFAGYSNAREYFLYSEAIGREIPSDNRYYHLGVTGRFDVAREGGLDYRLQLTSHRMSNHQNKLDADYDWRHQRFLGDVELSRRWSKAAGNLGAGYEIRSIEATDALSSNPTRLGKLYGSVTAGPVGRSAHDVGAMVLVASGTPSLKVHWNARFDLGRTHVLDARLAYAQRSFAENGDLWYWTGRGYSFLDSIGVEYSLPDEVGKSSAATADVSWWIGTGRSARVGLSALYRHFADVYLEQRSFWYDAEDCAVTSPTEIVTDNSGQLAGGSLEFDWRLFPNLHTRWYYRFLGTVTGDELFKDTWATIPEHKAAAQVTYEPVNRFIIWAMLTTYSSTYWKAYEAVDGARCPGAGLAPTYSARVKAFTTVDVKVRKLLWGRRMSADVIARNLLDREIRYHPMGATFSLSFFLQLTFSLDSP